MAKFSKLVLFIFNSDTKSPWIEKFSELAEEVEVITTDTDFSGNLSPEALDGADAFATRAFDNYPEIIKDNSSLKYIGTITTDTSCFDRKQLAEKGITLTNVAGYARNAVGELTMAALLMISRKLFETVTQTRKGDWELRSYGGFELTGKTIGIIGLGSIGSKVAEIAHGLGMQVKYYSRTRKSDLEDKFAFCDLDELVSSADVISLHCGLEDDTRGILNAELISKMKEGSILLNSDREELIDHSAVLPRVAKGEITVWYDELQDKDLRAKYGEYENVYLTPVFGCQTKEALEGVWRIAIENMKSFLSGV